MRQLVTDRELRRLWDQGEFHTFTVEEGTVVTPSARDFLLEHRIELRLQPKGKTMTVEPIAAAGGAPRYVIEATGERVEEKPEEMTHLRGNRLVPKTHPRILFRGKLDSLMAAFLSAEVTAAEQNRRRTLEELEELLGFLRQILAAEVKEEPLGEIQEGYGTQTAEGTAPSYLIPVDVTRLIAPDNKEYFWAHSSDSWMMPKERYFACTENRWFYHRDRHCKYIANKENKELTYFDCEEQARASGRKRCRTCFQGE